MSKVAEFKQLFKSHWYIVFPVHLILTAIWFTFFYTLATSGFDISPIMGKLNTSEESIEDAKQKTQSSAGMVTLTLLLLKLSTPIRYPISFVASTIVIRFLRKHGILKTKSLKGGKPV